MQLPNVMPAGMVRFSTPSDNSGAIYLSASPANAETVSTRFAIAASKHFPLKISDLSLLYALGTASDALDILCETTGGENESSKSS